MKNYLKIPALLFILILFIAFSGVSLLLEYVQYPFKYISNQLIKLVDKFHNESI
jgi:hypothetical protein